MKKSAFSLIELSIVCVIIGIMVVGTIQGAAMINTARLANARSATAKSPVPNISGLIAWYETSMPNSLKPSEAVEGAKITSWYDISPNSIIGKKNTLTRTGTTAVIYKSSGINKIPSISFSGADENSTDTLRLANFYQGSSAQSTIFLVIRPSMISSQIILDSVSSTTALGIDGSLYMNCGISAGAGVSSTTIKQNSNYVINYYLNGANSKIYLNNAATQIASLNPGSNFIIGLKVGANHDNQYNFRGMISEVIIYNKVLQLQERKDVMKYLSKKYAIDIAGS